MHAADKELLTCLIEECSEVIHAATKTLRHGLHSHNPRELAGSSNREQLNKEVGDLQAITTLLRQRDILDRWAAIRAHDRKLKTIGQYLHESDIVDGKIITRRKA